MVTNRPYGVLYAGVTSNLVQRIYQHKNEVFEGFTKKYNCKVLVYYEAAETIESAIIREKQIKNMNREEKLRLIEKQNSCWRDLSSDLST